MHASNVLKVFHSMASSSNSNSNSNSKDEDEDEDEEDLDTFLTTMESKLRGPFSSLDLAKAVTTNALRGSHTPAQYLQNVSKVLSRTDKVIQSRILIGLLGIEPNSSSASASASANNNNNNIPEDDTNREIHRIVQQAQRAPAHEEWARTIAGLVQGIMFETPEAAAAAAAAATAAFEGASHRSCRGPEATKLLDQLCDEVCANVQTLLLAQEATSTSTSTSSTSTSTTYCCPDLNASFTPYRYSLLPDTLLRVLVPECSEAAQNPHFQVHTQASILRLDEQLETQRALEEQEHQGPVLMTKTKNNMGSSTIHGTSDGAAKKANAGSSSLPPGFRPTKLVQTAAGAKGAAASKAASTSTNMFMPKKPNPLLVQRQKQVQQKTLLRRKGAAQSLVNKTKVKHRVVPTGAGSSTVVGAMAVLSGVASGTTSSGVTSTASNTATPAAAATAATSRVRATAGKFGRAVGGGGGGGGGAAMAGRSKMKMIDVTEVTNLTKVHAARDAAETTGRMSKKRRIMEAAAAAKKAKLEPTATATATPTTSAASTTSAAAAAAAATTSSTTNGKPQAALPATTQSNATAATSSSAAAPSNNSSTTQEEEWKVLLKGRSNKLSDEDRQRVQQFFQSRHNPTPDQSLVKMKLHEQRSQDPATGQAVKETFYLELDYTNFSSKQSRKVKRY